MFNKKTKNKNTKKLMIICFPTEEPFTISPQSKGLRIQNDQLQQANVSLGSEVEKLQKQLERARVLQGGDSQLTSLQEELDKMKEQLEEASLQKKKMEEEHSTEKLDLQQVMMMMMMISHDVDLFISLLSVITPEFGSADASDWAE